jgi:hypothetical protein
MLPPLHEWEGFYVITGSSAAALTGLMFVVITLTAERRISKDGAGVHAFATPTVFHFGVVLLLAGIMTTPAHTPASLAFCLAITGLGGLAYVGSVARMMLQQTDYAPVLSDKVWHVSLPALAYALVLVAAFLLREHPEAALRIVGLVTMGVLFIGIHNAWDAAVWVSIRPPDQ